MRALVIAAVAAAAANALRMRPRAAPPAQTSIGEANFFDLDPSSPAFADLGVTGWQQTTDYTCGPSSVMSIMRFYGVLNASQMTHETEMAFAKGMGTRSDNGTDPILMAAWLQSVRFGSAWAQGGNISLVRDFLARGQPIVVLWSDWGGHYVASTGYYAGSGDYNDGLDTVFFADPAAHFQNVNNTRGVTGFVSDRMESMWFNLNSGIRTTFGVYVTMVPQAGAAEAVAEYLASVSGDDAGF